MTSTERCGDANCDLDSSLTLLSIQVRLHMQLGDTPVIPNRNLWQIPFP
jgi:hypothetical protein